METNVQSFSIFSIQIGWINRVVAADKIFSYKSGNMFWFTISFTNCLHNFAAIESFWKCITRWWNQFNCWNLLVCHLKKLVCHFLRNILDSCEFANCILWEVSSWIPDINRIRIISWNRRQRHSLYEKPTLILSFGLKLL